MSFAGNLMKIIKEFDKHDEYFHIFTDIIGKLQPLAFLISASLVLAVYYFNINPNSISGIYALFASVSFFFAYLGFVWYKITNYRLAFYWGLFLIVISVILIYNSFRDAFTRIISIDNIRINILAFYILFSLIILITKFILNLSNKDSRRYRISNIVLYIITSIILIYIPLALILHLTYIPLLLVSGLTRLIIDNQPPHIEC
jgi:hypothetical protein